MTTCAGRTVWITLLLGVYLFFVPEIWALEGEAASSLNARLVGVCIIGVTMFTLGIPELKGVEWMNTLLGCWLLVAPFVLGYGGAAGWNAWSVGALMLSLVGVRNDPFALWAWLQANIVRYRSRKITPMDIIQYRVSEEPLSPEVLSRQIMERSEQIRRTLLGEPSEAEIEMCALGCSACMDDLITLALLIKEEQPRSGPVRRIRLKAAYRRATTSLSRTRQALRLYTVSLQSEEHSQK